jgi:hypothetical protein
LVAGPKEKGEILRDKQTEMERAGAGQEQEGEKRSGEKKEGIRRWGGGGGGCLLLLIMFICLSSPGTFRRLGIVQSTTWRPTWPGAQEFKNYKNENNRSKEMIQYLQMYSRGECNETFNLLFLFPHRTTFAKFYIYIYITISPRFSAVWKLYS